jgi:hypothetical protein
MRADIFGRFLGFASDDVDAHWSSFVPGFTTSLAKAEKLF